MALSISIIKTLIFF
ncbi:UNVERIFIED_CONTAM: hypothetical protein GTU68_049698 [Idotea baltica]|nr:hypothetical protein [Idotea baltica]